MADELDELVSMTAADDATTLRDILARNPTLKTALDSRQVVYKAFVDGDQAALDAATRAQATRTTTAASTVTSPAATSAAALTLDQLDAELDKRMVGRFKTFTESPEFTTAVETRAEARAKQLLEASTETILGTAAKTSDTIYQIRRSHEKEFGKELDTTAFTTYLDANKGKFISLEAAHDAFVQEDRITKRIADGVVAARAAEQTSDVPGTSLPSAQTPLGAMIRANPASKDAGDRGTGIDAAVKAFRQLQSSHVN